MPMWEVPAHQQAITSVAILNSPSATRVLTARYVGREESKVDAPSIEIRDGLLAKSSGRAHAGFGPQGGGVGFPGHYQPLSVAVPTSPP